MRGVCALNLEAMSMFREGEEGGRRPPPAAAAVNNNGAISHLSIYKIWFIVFGVTMDSNLLKNSWNLKIGKELDLFYLRMMLRQISQLPPLERVSPIVVISEASQWSGFTFSLYLYNTKHNSVTVLVNIAYCRCWRYATSSTSTSYCNNVWSNCHASAVWSRSRQAQASSW